VTRSCLSCYADHAVVFCFQFEQSSEPAHNMAIPRVLEHTKTGRNERRRNVQSRSKTKITNTFTSLRSGYRE
jgi:hypothetical protein